MEPRRILVDTTHFPLVVVRFTRGYDDGDVEHMLRSLERLLHGGSRYALLVYCDPDAAVVVARQRRRVSEWYHGHAVQVQRLNVATAVVIESALVRGAMTAFQWIMEPLSTQRSVASIADGIAYIIDALHKANMDVPTEVYALRQASEHKLKQLA